MSPMIDADDQIVYSGEDRDDYDPAWKRKICYREDQRSGVVLWMWIVLGLVLLGGIVLLIGMIK